jgi:hypothetical protein
MNTNNNKNLLFNTIISGARFVRDQNGQCESGRYCGYNSQASGLTPGEEALSKSERESTGSDKAPKYTDHQFATSSGLDKTASDDDEERAIEQVNSRR